MLLLSLNFASYLTPLLAFCIVCRASTVASPAALTATGATRCSRIHFRGHHQDDSTRSTVPNQRRSRRSQRLTVCSAQSVARKTGGWVNQIQQHTPHKEPGLFTIGTVHNQSQQRSAMCGVGHGIMYLILRGVMVHWWNRNLDDDRENLTYVDKTTWT